MPVVIDIECEGVWAWADTPEDAICGADEMIRDAFKANPVQSYRPSAKLWVAGKLVGTHSR